MIDSIYLLRNQKLDICRMPDLPYSSDKGPHISGYQKKLITMKWLVNPLKTYPKSVGKNEYGE